MFPEKITVCSNCLKQSIFSQALRETESAYYAFLPYTDRETGEPYFGYFEINKTILREECGYHNKQINMMDYFHLLHVEPGESLSLSRANEIEVFYAQDVPPVVYQNTEQQIAA